MIIKQTNKSKKLIHSQNKSPEHFRLKDLPSNSMIKRPFFHYLS